MGLTWLSVLSFVVLSAASAWPKRATSDKRSLLLEDPEAYFPSNVEEIPVRYLPRKALKLEVNSEGQVQGLQTGTLMQNEEESDDSEEAVSEVQGVQKAVRSLPLDQEAVGQQTEMNSKGSSRLGQSEASKLLEDHGDFLEVDDEHKDEGQDNDEESQSDKHQAKQLLAKERGLARSDAMTSWKQDLAWSQCRDTKVFQLPGNRKKMGSVWEAAWSPDGLHIALRLGADPGPFTQAFVFPADGIEQPQLLGQASGMGWSSTGQLILSKATATECSVSYWGSDDGEWKEVKAPVAIRFEHKGCSGISWSKDEMWWAVSSQSGGSQGSRAVLFVYQVLQGELKRQAFAQTLFRGAMQPRMSPSGQHIFLWRLYSSLLKGGEGILFTRSGANQLAQRSRLTWRAQRRHVNSRFLSADLPEWSQDSKWVAVPAASTILRLGDGGWNRTKLFLKGIAAWSPQNRLAFRISTNQPNFRVSSPIPQDGSKFMGTLTTQFPDVGKLQSMAWSPNGQHLVCGGPKGRAVIGTVAGSDFFALTDSKAHAWPRRSSWIYADKRLSWSPDAIYLAVVTTSLVVWRLNYGGLSTVWEQNVKVPLTVAWSPKTPNMELATAQLNDQLRIWTMTGDLLSVIKMGQGSRGYFGYYCMSWSPDGQELATAGNWYRTLKIWERKGTSLVLQLELATEDQITSISWSTDGHLAAGTWGGHIIVWMKAENSWKTVQDIKRPAEIQTLAWSPDGSRLASGITTGIDMWHFSDRKLALEESKLTELGYSTFTWAPDSKQFMARSLFWSIWRTCYVARLGKEFDKHSSFVFSGVVQEVAWSPNQLHVAVATREGKPWSYVVNLVQLVQPGVGSWPAQMSMFQAGPESCDERTCVQKKLGLVDLHLSADATDVAWGMFPCARSHSLWGRQRYNLVTLTLKWPERPTTWSKAITAAEDLCSKVFASFEHLESLRLEEPKIKGLFSCEEQKNAGALKNLEILGGLMELPTWSLETVMVTSPRLKQVKLVKIAFQGLEGSPGHNLDEIAIHQTDLRGIARPFLAANLLLDCPGNANLQLPYALTERCEIAEDIGPICLEQRSSADDKIELQAFVLQEERWVKGARLRVDSSRLCVPGFVYQINAEKSGCEPCPEDTFSSNTSVSEDVKMVCLPCKENQVTHGTATSLDDCLCVEKYAKDGDDCKLCSELPEGEAYECNVVGLTVETVPVKEGFWRDNDNDTVPLRCGRRGEPFNGCQGGPAGSICRTGHSGFKCRQCEAMHFLREGECVRCTTDQLQNPAILFDLAVAGSLVLGSAFAFRLTRRRLRTAGAGENQDFLRQDLLQPPKPQDALKSYLMREVMAAIQVYQLFGVLSKILPQKKQRVEARILDNLNIGPVLLDGLHLDCVMPFTTSRLLQLVIDPLLPLPLLLGFYLSILLTVQDKEKRRKMWTNCRMKAFNILLIPTVGSIFNAGLCDGDRDPPVMMSAPEVSCRSLAYYEVSIFVSCLGSLYIIGAAVMILRTLARYQTLMWKAKFILPCHQFDDKKNVLKIYCTGQNTGDLQTACLEAAEIHYQQLLDDSKLSLVDVPEDADYRMLNVERAFASEVVEAPLTERSVAYFKALVVRCVLLQLDKEARHGDIRGMTDILTKFCPDSFHFFLFLKVGQVLIAYVPSLEGNRAQGAVGSFVCSILAIGLLSQPYSRPSEGRTLFAGLLALGLAFFMVMLSETHLNMQGEESLTRLMQIARCFQVVPMMRVLIPVWCFISKTQRDRSVDFKQEQLLRTAAWKDVPPTKRQPFRVVKPANLELSDLPMTIKKGTVVLPLRCVEKRMEVELRTRDRVVTGLVPLAALKKQPVAVKDLNSEVAQLKAEKVPAMSDWTKHAGSGPTIWYNAKTQEIAWSEPEDKGPSWRVAIDFKSKVALSAIKLTNTKGFRPSLAVHTTDSGIWPVPDNVQDIKFQEQVEMKVDKHFLQYHLHCDVNHCTLLLSSGSQPDSIELGDSPASSAWKLTLLGNLRAIAAPTSAP